MRRKYAPTSTIRRKVVNGLITALIMTGIVITGLEGMALFQLLPPVLRDINIAGFDLADYNPKTAQEFRENGPQYLAVKAAGLYTLGDSLPCSVGSCLIIDFSDQRDQIIKTGDTLSVLSQRIANGTVYVGEGVSYDRTLRTVNEAGWSLIGIKDYMYYAVSGMFGIGILMILTGLSISANLVINSRRD